MGKVKKQLMNWEEIFSTCRTKKRLTHRRRGIPVSQQKTRNSLAKNEQKCSRQITQNETNKQKGWETSEKMVKIIYK